MVFLLMYLYAIRYLRCDDTVCVTGTQSLLCVLSSHECVSVKKTVNKSHAQENTT